MTQMPRDPKKSSLVGRLCVVSWPSGLWTKYSPERGHVKFPCDSLFLILTDETSSSTVGDKDRIFEISVLGPSSGTAVFEAGCGISEQVRKTYHLTASQAMTNAGWFKPITHHSNKQTESKATKWG